VSRVVFLALTTVFLMRPVVAAEPAASTDIAVLRAGLEMVVDTLRASPELFPPPASNGGPTLLDPQARDMARSLWSAFADRLLSLEALEDQLPDASGLDQAVQGTDQHSALALRRAAFLARYRFAMDFIEAANREPSLDQLFNEAHSSLGLAERSYAQFKFHYLNIARATEFAALELLYITYHSATPEPLAEGAHDDARRIVGYGIGSGPRMTADNALKVVADTARIAVMPTQERVARWAGDVRVRRHGEALISPTQIAGLLAKLEPGDVLLQRREWYLTNAGIPGFWTHAALYIGTPAERRAFFDDEAVRAWAAESGATDFEALLNSARPEAYVASRQPDGNQPARVLEAIADGVVFTSIEHSAAADSMAVLRPRLSKVERAAALLRAFEYAGRPYDYDFDFRTDTALVCSELIYKSYEPGAHTRGLDLDLQWVSGRPMITPNEMARHFALTRHDEERPFDFVLMLDGSERSGSAHPATAEVFATSWQRPKWHIVFTDTQQP